MQYIITVIHIVRGHIITYMCMTWQIWPPAAFCYFDDNLGLRCVTKWGVGTKWGKHCPLCGTAIFLQVLVLSGEAKEAKKCCQIWTLPYGYSNFATVFYLLAPLWSLQNCRALSHLLGNVCISHSYMIFNVNLLPGPFQNSNHLHQNQPLCPGLLGVD